VDEITSLQWRQVDLENYLITVGRAKTSSGTGRQLQINEELLAVLLEYRDWYSERFAEFAPSGICSRSASRHRVIQRGL